MIAANTNYCLSDIDPISPTRWRAGYGVLAVGYAPSASFEVLPTLVPAYRARSPEVRLDLLEMRSPDQPDALREGRIEIGFVCAPVETTGLEEHVIARERLAVVLPVKHRLARRARIPVRALQGEPYVSVPADVEPGWAQRSMAALRDAGVTLEVAQEADSKLAMLGLVAAGMGISVVSESMAVLAPRGVVFRPVAGIDTRLVLSVLCARSPSPRARALVDLAIARR